MSAPEQNVALCDFEQLAATTTDPAKAYTALAEFAVREWQFSACAVYLASASKEPSLQLHLVAHAGSPSITCPMPWSDGGASGSRTCAITYRVESGDGCCYFHDLVGPDGYLGTVGVRSDRPIEEVTDILRRLAFSASLIGERARLLRKVKHLNDRNEIFRELTQLIGANADIDRSAKALVRQGALRFGADASLLLLLNNRGDALEVIGNYGTTKNLKPGPLSVQNTFLGRTLRLGTILSVPDLKLQPDHGLDFLVQSGILAARFSHLDVKGEPLGMLLLGYRHSTAIASHDEDLFRDFCQGSAVVLATARSQARLKAYAEQLEELVQLRTADLKNQTLKAEEASRAKSRFVANMSHELRTPLTAIVGYSSVIADGVFGPINEKQRDALVNISRSSGHLKELIDEVLNLSRIEAGKEDPEASKVELYSLLQQVYKLMLQTAVGKSVQLCPVNIPAEIRDTKLWVDPRHVRQILINLISNAVKYTPEGGRVELSAEIVGDKVKIGVRDTGVGIAPAKVGRLFERFERGDDSYSREQIGTGIGLALTKHLTEINGGKIGAESELGKGSHFWVMIPCAESDGTEVNAVESGEAPEVQSRLDGLNILVCDDNELTCNVLQTVISHAGGAAFVARTVAEAKQIAESVQLDVAVVDLAIPGESGVNLLDYFRRRASSATGTIPMIVVSACVFDSDRANALEHGAGYFVPKPFRPSDIVRTIRLATTSAAINSTTTFHVS